MEDPGLVPGEYTNARPVTDQNESDLSEIRFHGRLQSKLDMEALLAKYAFCARKAIYSLQINSSLVQTALPSNNGLAVLGYK